MACLSQQISPSSLGPDVHSARDPIPIAATTLSICPACNSHTGGIITTPTSVVAFAVHTAIQLHLGKMMLQRSCKQYFGWRLGHQSHTCGGRQAKGKSELHRQDQCKKKQSKKWNYWNCESCEISISTKSNSSWIEIPVKLSTKKLTNTWKMLSDQRQHEYRQV